MSNNFSDSLPVKIGAGADFVTTSSYDAKTLLDVNVGNIGNAVAGVPYVDNVNMQFANTEYSYSLLSNTKQIMFKVRNNSYLKFSFQAGQSSTKYISVPPGTLYTLSGVDPTTPLTLYFQGNENSETLEIIYWV